MSQHSFLETPAATTEFTRQRYDEARQRRDRSSRGLFPGLSDDSYQAENEAARQLRRPSSRRRSARTLRGGANAGASSSPTREAVVAAELAARDRRAEVRMRSERAAAAAERARQSAATAEDDDDDDDDDGDDDDEAEDLPHTRGRSDAADALYNIRMGNVVRECFRYWHKLTIKQVVRRQDLEQMAARLDRRVLLKQGLNSWQEERWFAVVASRAERRYNTKLAVRAWGVWVQKTAAIVQRTHEVRQRILMRKYFNAWRTIVVENEEKIRLFQLSNVFWKWRERTREQERKALVAQGVFEANLAHRAYWTWFFQLCGILGARRHQRSVCERAFDSWVQKTEKIIQMNRMADAFHRRRTLQVLFNRWSERTFVCLEQQVAAEDHEEWKLIEGTFDYWRRSAKLAPLAAVVGDYVNDRVTIDFFTLWRQRMQQVKFAEAIAQRQSLQSGLKTWRLRLRQKILEEQVLEQLQGSKLHNWILQTRLHGFQCSRAANLCRTTLTQWSSHHHTLVHKLETIAHKVVVLRNRGIASHLLTGLKRRLEFRREEAIEAEAHHNYTIVTKALHHWSTRAQHAQSIRRLETDATRVRHRHLLNKTFDHWRLKTELCRTYGEWAEDAIYYFTVRRTMHQWKAAYKDHKRDRLREAFHTQARKTKRDLADRVLGCWLAKADHIQYLNLAGQQFCQRRVESTAVDSIRVWRLQAEEITTLRIAAEEYDRVRLLRTYLQLWSDYSRFVSDRYEEAEILYETQSIRIASKYLRIWETAGWHLNTKRMMVVKFQKRRYKDLLKNWRNAAMEKVQRRTWLQGRGIDETIDEGFGVEWVQPLPISRASTPTRAPEPARREELGRSVSGRSIFRHTVRGAGSLRKSLLGQSVRGTPAARLPLQTPSWRTEFFDGTPGGPVTPRNMMTPGSPLMRFSNRRELGVMDESRYE